MLARALILNPKLLIADEPTSALDVSVQAKVLELFKEIQREFGFAALFISHDLAVVDMLSHWVGVLYKGKLVEQGIGQHVMGAPQHDYTKRLIASLPVPDPAEQAKRRRTTAPSWASSSTSGSKGLPVRHAWRTGRPFAFNCLRLTRKPP